MLNYQINIPDLMKDGHPFQEFSTNLAIASARYDELAKLYPYNMVKLSEIKITLIKSHQDPVPRLPNKVITECGNKHSGKNINGGDIVRLGSNGKHFCSICTWEED